MFKRGKENLFEPGSNMGTTSIKRDAGIKGRRGEKERKTVFSNCGGGPNRGQWEKNYSMTVENKVLSGGGTLQTMFWRDRQVSTDQFWPWGEGAVRAKPVEGIAKRGALV